MSALALAARFVAGFCSFAPQDGPTAPSGVPPAPPAPVELGPKSGGDGTFTIQLQGPPDLPEAIKADVRRKLAFAVETLRANVVQLSIEQRVGEDVFVAVEASGLVLDPSGLVVTIGSTIEQASRVAVHFTCVPPTRPRRARIVGIDEKTDVGVLEIGPISLPRLDLTAPAASPSAPAAARYVVTLCGVPDEQDGRFCAGWLHDPLRNPKFGRRSFELLLRVATTRSPRCAGGVLAQQDGRVVGLMLAPAQATGGAIPVDAMLALPAEALRRGVESVLGQPQPAARAPDAASRSRAWIGFGASDLEESEFLRHLGVPHAVVVSEIFEASPALAAGIEPHDVLLHWNGEALPDVDTLQTKLHGAAPGSVVTLDCVRGLERREAKVKLGAW